MATSVIVVVPVLTFHCPVAVLVKYNFPVGTVPPTLFSNVFVGVMITMLLELDLLYCILAAVVKLGGGPIANVMVLSGSIVMVVITFPT